MASVHIDRHLWKMPAQVLGILLVCYSSRGHQLVFSYPPDHSFGAAPAPDPGEATATAAANAAGAYSSVAALASGQTPTADAPSASSGAGNLSGFDALSQGRNGLALDHLYGLSAHIGPASYGLRYPNNHTQQHRASSPPLRLHLPLSTRGVHPAAGKSNNADRSRNGKGDQPKHFPESKNGDKPPSLDQHVSTATTHGSSTTAKTTTSGASKSQVQVDPKLEDNSRLPRNPGPSAIKGRSRAYSMANDVSNSKENDPHSTGNTKKDPARAQDQKESRRKDDYDGRDYTESRKKTARTSFGDTVVSPSGGPLSVYSGKENFLGFDTHFLSDILSPKDTLCDKEFRFTVDNITFIGHPTLLHADRPGTGHRFARMIQRRRMPKITQSQTMNMASLISKSNISNPNIMSGKKDSWTNLTDAYEDQGIQFIADSAAGVNSKLLYSLQRQQATKQLKQSVADIRFSMATVDEFDAFVDCGDATQMDSMGIPWSAAANSLGNRGRDIGVPFQEDEGIYSNAEYSNMPTDSNGGKGMRTTHNEREDDTRSNGRHASFGSYGKNESSEYQRSFHDSHHYQTDLGDSGLTIGDMADSPVRQGNPANQISMFNLVFAMEPTQEDAFSDDATNLYIHVISKLTAALKHEQMKRGYIRKEAELILEIKEEALANTYGKKITQTEVTERIMKESSLANCLAHVYHSIKNDRVCHVVINSSVDLSLQVPDNNILTSYRLPNFQSTLTQSESMPVIRPYHALLLMYDPEEILKFLPLDPTPLLIDLIRIVTPSQSFDELHTILDCSLSQLYKLVAHLVHWKVARIIDVVSVKNVYVLHPDAHIDAKNMADFAERYPQLPGSLAETLADLSMPQPFQEIIPRKELRTLYLEVLTFLLRHKLVSQLHMYIFLMIPGSIKIVNSPTSAKSASKSSKSLTQPVGDSQKPHGSLKAWSSSTYKPDTKSPTGEASKKDEENQFPDFEVDYKTVANVSFDGLAQEQLTWLQYTAQLYAPSTTVAELFMRLVPYFMAKTHVEEILYRENMRRKDLKLVLVTYKSVLKTALLP